VGSGDAPRISVAMPAFNNAGPLELYQRGARPPMPRRPAFMMNLVFYFWGHRWIYDFDELRHALVEAGFAPDSVVRRAFHEGALPEVAMLDRETRRHETMYVEAGAA
jgi:hypothetical protein